MVASKDLIPSFPGKGFAIKGSDISFVYGSGHTGIFTPSPRALSQDELLENRTRFHFKPMLLRSFLPMVRPEAMPPSRLYSYYSKFNFKED